jgi:hypothetical protein
MQLKIQTNPKERNLTLERFERFFILGGPRGTRHKKLKNLDSTNHSIN